MYMKSADFDPKNPSGIDSTYLKNSGGQNPWILTPRILGTDLRIITHHPTTCGLIYPAQCLHYPHKYPHTQQPSIYHHVFTAHLILFTISAMFYGLILF